MKLELPVMTPKQRVLRPSFSRWDNFSNRCERLYALDILFPQGGSEAMARGSQVHDLFEMFLRRVREKAYDMEAALASMEETPWPEGPRTVEELRPFLATCARLVTKWGGQPKHIEEWVNVVDGMPFSGKIDLIIDDPKHGMTVCDWKTCSTTTYAKTEREVKKSLQLQIYCLAVDVRRAGFVYLPNSAEPLEVFTTFTEATLERAKTRLRALSETIATRWKNAGFTVERNSRGLPFLPIDKNPEGMEIDLTAFAEAGSELQWCHEKYCQQWKNCLGRPKD